MTKKSPWKTFTIQLSRRVTTFVTIKAHGIDDAIDRYYKKVNKNTLRWEDEKVVDDGEDEIDRVVEIIQ